MTNSLTVGARLAQVRALRALVQSLAEPSAGRPSFEAGQVARWALAVTEAATNAIRHAYGGDCDATLTLVIQADPTRLVFRLIDHGRAAETWPPVVADATFPAEGSYGLAIIGKVMDEVAYERTADGANVLTMVAQVAATQREREGA